MLDNINKDLKLIYLKKRMFLTSICEEIEAWFSWR